MDASWERQLVFCTKAVVLDALPHASIAAALVGEIGDLKCHEIHTLVY